MATKPKINMRAVFVELPEPDMLKIVTAAKQVGATTHDYIRKILTDTLKGST